MGAPDFPWQLSHFAFDTDSKGAWQVAQSSPNRTWLSEREPLATIVAPPMNASATKRIVPSSAMKAARMLASFVKLGARSQRQHALPMYTQIQFSRWDQILATPQPSDEHAYLQFVWRYGRAMAYLRGGDVEASNANLDEMRRLAVSDGVRKSRVRQVNGMTEIAIGMVKGEIAAATGDYDAAIEALAVARGIEDGLSYHETRTWPHPVQITLGRILADAGRIDEAEAALLENLTESPENGWALFELSRVYRLQGKGSEADAVLARYEAAWEFADRTVLEGG